MSGAIISPMIKETVGVHLSCFFAPDLDFCACWYAGLIAHLTWKISMDELKRRYWSSCALRVTLFIIAGLSLTMIR